MQNETEITLKPTPEKPKRKSTRRKPRKPRTRTRRAKADEANFLMMATAVNSGLIALLFILHFFKVI